MAETQAHINDRLQWRLTLAEDAIKRLEARVKALEAGQPLPPDQKPEFNVTPKPVEAPAPAPAQTVAPVPQPKPVDGPELDLSVGLPAGGRRV